MPIAPQPRDARSLRRQFSESALVRTLGAWGFALPDSGRFDPAERLSQWLGVADAITLHSTHQSIRAMGAGDAARTRPAAAPAVDRELERVRTALVAAILGKASSDSDHLRTRRPAPPIAVAGAPQADFARYHQRHLTMQREMDLRIDALRGFVRKALADASPRLGQLAALDSAMDQMLAARAHKLLASVPKFLETRFKQRRKSPPESESTWLAAFEQELQDLLLAELEVRLQPVVGMAEALRNEFKNHP